MALDGDRTHDDPNNPHVDISFYFTSFFVQRDFKLIIFLFTIDMNDKYV